MANLTPGHHLIQQKDCKQGEIDPLLEARFVEMPINDRSPGNTMETRRPCIVFRIGGVLMSVGILSLPLIAFLFAVVVSIVKDFEASTATHCRVRWMGVFWGFNSSKGRNWIWLSR